jgi:acyl-CoA dehydrogenase
VLPMSTPRSAALAERITAFTEEHIYPAESVFERELGEAKDRWSELPVMTALKAKAKAAGLWNLWLPRAHNPEALTNLEYAPLCEIMGRSPIGAEPFNCSAPDTGNMETLIRYGSDEQKARWLTPLLDGDIRSCFAMTEPDVASSESTATATITLSAAASGGRPARWTSAARSPSSWDRPTPMRSRTSGNP